MLRIMAHLDKKSELDVLTQDLLDLKRALTNKVCALTMRIDRLEKYNKTKEEKDQEEKEKKKVVFSCSTFGKFTTYIDLLDVYKHTLGDKDSDLTDTFIKLAALELKNHLVKFNFTELLIKFNELKFHIHDHTWESIASSEKDIFVCSHVE